MIAINRLPNICCPSNTKRYHFGKRSNFIQKKKKCLFVPSNWCCLASAILFSLIFWCRDVVCFLNFLCKMCMNLIYIKPSIMLKGDTFLLTTQAFLSCFDKTFEWRVLPHDFWLLLSTFNSFFMLNTS